jgi:hypothetical protein
VASVHMVCAWLSATASARMDAASESVQQVDVMCGECTWVVRGWVRLPVRGWMQRVRVMIASAHGCAWLSATECDCQCDGWIQRTSATVEFDLWFRDECIIPFLFFRFSEPEFINALACGGCRHDVV